MFRIRSPLQMYTGLEYACATAHCASTIARQQLHVNNFTATNKLQQLYYNNFTAAIALQLLLQQLHCKNCIAQCVAHLLNKER